MAVSVGLGTALVASQVAWWHSMTAQELRDFDTTSRALIGMLFAAVVLGALAVRSVTAEHSTGMIRTTFTARPARRTVLAAKAAAVAALAFRVALLSNLVGFELGQILLTAKHARVSLSHPGMVPAIILGSVAVSVVAVIGVGLGGIIRARQRPPRRCPRSSSEERSSPTSYRPGSVSSCPRAPLRQS